MRAARAVPFLLLAATAASAALRPEIRPVGPLRVRSQFPLDMVTLDTTPESAFMREPGSIWLSLDVVHANTFEITPAYDAHVTAFDAGVFPPTYDFNVDTETTRTSLAAEFQVGRRVALGFEAPLITHGGGFMDSTIEDFHDTFGLPQNDRDLKGRDLMNIDILAGKDRLRDTSSDTQFGDLVLRGRFLLWGGRRGAWTLVTEAKAPTGKSEDFTGSGAWDYGASLIVTAGGRHHVFHGGAGYQVLGQPSHWPFAIDNRATAYAGYEFDANARWAILAHVMAATSILPSQADYTQDQPRAELVLGFDHGGDRVRFHFGVIENLLTNDNDLDLGLMAGLSWYARP